LFIRLLFGRVSIIIFYGAKPSSIIMAKSLLNSL
jgi:hypothetical protein